MSNESGTSNQVISLPQGGGALQGIGEKFSPDLFTGTGNFTVPIALPPGRGGFQPELSLVYSTGNGNGPFGLGWGPSVPGVARKTSKGVPSYDDAEDTFVLSSAEDLVPVKKEETDETTTTRYRPRTEGLFARIDHHRDAESDYWKVRSKDGLVSFYGTPGTAGEDPAVVADPEKRNKVFAWKLTRTEDPFGNRVVYAYERDLFEGGSHRSDQLYLKEVRYVDYEDDSGEDRFLVSVRFVYEDELDGGAQERPDPFSEHRAGFEIRTRRRCKRIEVRTLAGQDPVAQEEATLVRTYELVYLDERAAAGELPETRLPRNGVSLLSQVRVTGHDESREAEEDRAEELPPLEFGYARFEPEEREFFPLEGQLPATSLASPDLELADLSGDGLPDILQMNGTARYWKNRGDGAFDLPREMSEAPAGLGLADPGVQLIDADGDGRIDLFATRNGLSGYFPLNFDGEWDRNSFRRYAQAPSFDLEDPEVELVDLDGDGVTDALRSGARFECFFNDPEEGWSGTRRVPRQGLDEFPNVNFSDPRVRWADITGDGLQDVVLVHDGNVEYWPSLGYGEWGPPVHMRGSPRFPHGYNPKRILLGDVDGDGCADLVYVDHRKVLLWINQSGNGFGEPTEIDGTPAVTDVDAVRLVDMLGTGIGGLLWSADANGLSPQRAFFLDFTGGVKPYVLDEMDNHTGAVTKVGYAPSTRYYLEDQKRPDTAWQTTLPFPVQVVSRVEVIDHLSKGKLTTEYRYHHGYWDGAEREFRGFGMVEQLDTEKFEDYNGTGLHGDGTDFAGFEEDRAQHFSPPTLTKTWFHQGPIGPEFGPWKEADYGHEFWSGDPPMLPRPEAVESFLDRLPRRVRRDAVRTLRGRILRTELYTLDGPDREERPYTVTESLHGVTSLPVDERWPDEPEEWQTRVFFPHTLAQGTTRWERGDEPMTQFSFTDDYDEYGQPTRQVAVAVPRWRGMDLGQRPRGDLPSAALTADTPAHVREHAEMLERYLATVTITDYAQKDTDEVYIVDRTARVTTYEIENKGIESLEDLRNAAIPAPEAGTLIGQTLNFYDGEAFTGLPSGEIGEHGALMRTETLVLDEAILQEAYGDEVPPYLAPDGSPAWTPEYPQEFQDNLPIDGPSDPTRPGLVITPVGYGFAAEGQDSPFERGYFVATERRRYDFHDGSEGRGLLTATRDPLGHESTIEYDGFDLFPTRVTDPAGLTTEALHDYRVLQPREVTDPNGNRQTFGFTPLGLAARMAVMGKDGEGDTEEEPGTRFEYDFGPFIRVDIRPDFQGDLDNETVSAGLRQELENGGFSLSAGATIQVREGGSLWLVIDGDRVYTASKAEDGLTVSSQPISVRTIRRVHHANDTEVPPEERDETIETVEYSDGFGRLLQTRTQAEDVVFGDPVFGDDVGLPADQSLPVGDAVGRNFASDDLRRVVVSGWQTYDNKGRVVEKYEPFFFAGWEYMTPSESQFGQKATMFYDPRGEVIRTVNPDRSEQLVIYGIPLDLAAPERFAPTAWEAYTYDENDNAGRTHPDGAAAYADHWNTPSSVVIDALGRTVETVERNGPDPGTDWFTTRYIYDIRGNLLAVTDALGRPAFRYVYDLADNPLRTESIDAGDRRTVLDATGSEIERRDSKDALILQAYDILNRSIRLWARDGVGQSLTLREHLIYGESPDSGLTEAEARTANLLGKPHKHYDEAGQLTFEAYDFKGNVLERVRQVVSDAEILSVFPSPEDPTPNREVQPFRVDWQPDGTTLEAHAATLLDPFEYRTSATHDALSRIQSMLYPEDVEDQRKELRPRYNRAGALEQVALDGDTYVEHIAYSAKGQRTLIALGNGVMTRYAYDPHTFRLARLRTERYTKPDPEAPTYEPGGAPLQDFAYVYDLVGNITKIHDRTPQSGVPNMPLGADALDREFTYDPLYRLRSATGRECDRPPDRPPWDDRPLCTNLTSVSAYTKRYRYDPLGNMERLRHVAGGGSFTRRFKPVPGTNHLDSLTVGNGTSKTYTSRYDDNGNLVREGAARYFEWHHSDRMKAFRTQPDGAPPSVHAHYFYDAGGQRVKKLVKKGGRVGVTVYVDGMFEHHRLVRGTRTRENNTLHVMDETRIAMVRVGDPFPNDSTSGVRFHLGDHLGSSNLVVNEDGSFINREEYTPYGETSFGSFAKKRYRFTGKERDEESGLYYYGARYYAPWLARWVSCDPSGPVDGFNLYVYAVNNPLRMVDPNGEQSHEAKEWVAPPQDVCHNAHHKTTRPTPPKDFPTMDIAEALEHVEDSAAVESTETEKASERLPSQRMLKSVADTVVPEGTKVPELSWDQLRSLERSMTNLLEDAEEYSTERELGIASIYTPGGATTGFLTGMTSWIEPKDDSVGSALLATGKSIVAAPVIFIGTPFSLLWDTGSSIKRNAVMASSFAPPGARLSQEGERIVREDLKAIKGELRRRWKLTGETIIRERGFFTNSTPNQLVPKESRK